VFSKSIAGIVWSILKGLAVTTRAAGIQNREGGCVRTPSFEKVACPQVYGSVEENASFYVMVGLARRRCIENTCSRMAWLGA
jgi:hypothetical protein